MKKHDKNLSTNCPTKPTHLLQPWRTSRATESHLPPTGHYRSSEWEMKSSVFQTHHFYQSECPFVYWTCAKGPIDGSNTTNSILVFSNSISVTRKPITKRLWISLYLARICLSQTILTNLPNKWKACWNQHRLPPCSSKISPSFNLKVSQWCHNDVMPHSFSFCIPTWCLLEKKGLCNLCWLCCFCSVPNQTQNRDN